MFGNRIGWLVAGVLVLFEVWLVYYLAVKVDAIQRPSEGLIPKVKFSLNLPQNPRLMEEIKLPFDPRTILPEMSKQQDAAPYYRAMLEKYLTNVNAYDDAFDAKAKPARYKSYDLKAYPGLEELVQGRECALMNLYQSQPEKAINYRNFADNFDPLYKIGKFANSLAMYMPEDRAADARLLVESVFSLGVKMMQERVRYAEFDNGQRIAREAALILARIDPSKDALVKKMDLDMRDLVRSINPLGHVIISVDQTVLGYTGGDVFYTVKNSRERMWRVEAVLKLGRYKYDVGVPGHGPNQKWARIMVKKMSNDSKEDPIVREAAKAANDLTLDDYRSIGT